MTTVIAIIMGCVLGLGISYLVTAILVSKSNSHGDSVAAFGHFTKNGLHMISSSDNIKKPRL